MVTKPATKKPATKKPATRKPSTKKPAEKPAIAPPNVRGAYLGDFAHCNAWPVACWSDAPTRVLALESQAQGGELGGDAIVCDGVVYGGACSYQAYAGALDARSSAKTPKDRWSVTLSTTQSWPVRGGASSRVIRSIWR